MAELALLVAATPISLMMFLTFRVRQLEKQLAQQLELIRSTTATQREQTATISSIIRTSENLLEGQKSLGEIIEQVEARQQRIVTLGQVREAPVFKAGSDDA